MKNTISKFVKGKNVEAEYLKDVPPEKSFWASNGWVIRNMEELPKALENMADETFTSHVNSDKNDFSTWIREVIGDKKLASIMQKVKNRQSAIDAINRRIKQLK
jgi:hypothetical protein